MRPPTATFKRSGLEQLFSRKTRPQIDAPQRKTASFQKLWRLEPRMEPCAMEGVISTDYWQWSRGIPLAAGEERSIASTPIYLLVRCNIPLGSGRT